MSVGVGLHLGLNQHGIAKGDWTLSSNLLSNASSFDNAAWQKGLGVAVTADSTTAPDGTTTADRVLETADASAHQLFQNVTFTATRQELSAYVKPIGRQWVRLMIYDGTNFLFGYFDVLNGATGTVSAGIRAASIFAAPNGFYRVAISCVPAAGAGSAFIHGSAADNGADTYAGDAAKGYYLWGARLRAT